MSVSKEDVSEVANLSHVVRPDLMLSLRLRLNLGSSINGLHSPGVLIHSDLTFPLQSIIPKF